MTAKTHMTRAIAAGARIDGTATAELLAMIRLLPCVMCGKRPPNHVDHVIPLSRKGPHASVNLMPLCPSCNSRKGQSLLPLRIELELTVETIALLSEAGYTLVEDNE